MVQYMVIETIKPGQLDKVYQRFHRHGRLLPEGLEFIDSWITADKTRVFQLMQSDTVERFEHWTALWRDLVEFEIIELGQKPMPSTRS